MSAAEVAGDTSVDGLSTANVALIDEELAEHQRWGAAVERVGAAGTSTRAKFLSDQYDAGMIGGGATGFVQGFATGAAIKAVELIAVKAAARLAGQAAAKSLPIPAIGAVIGGVMSAMDLAERDWGATGETIGKFGQGASDYEKLANSIAAICEVISVATAVLNVIAGIIGVIAIASWIITAATVGGAAPFAALLSKIAIGIGLASMALDAINALVLQPLVATFRSLHAFKSQGDPTQVEKQGESIRASGAASAGFVGGMAGAHLGGKAAEGGAKHLAGKPPPSTPHETPPPATGDGPNIHADPPPAAVEGQGTHATDPANAAAAPVDAAGPVPDAHATASTEAPASTTKAGETPAIAADTAHAPPTADAPASAAKPTDPLVVTADPAHPPPSAEVQASAKPNEVPAIAADPVQTAKPAEGPASTKPEPAAEPKKYGPVDERSFADLADTVQQVSDSPLGQKLATAETPQIPRDTTRSRQAIHDAAYAELPANRPAGYDSSTGVQDNHYNKVKALTTQLPPGVAPATKDVINFNRAPLQTALNKPATTLLTTKGVPDTHLGPTGNRGTKYFIGDKPMGGIGEPGGPPAPSSTPTATPTPKGKGKGKAKVVEPDYNVEHRLVDGKLYDEQVKLVQAARERSGLPPLDPVEVAIAAGEQNRYAMEGTPAVDLQGRPVKPLSGFVIELGRESQQMLLAPEVLSPELHSKGQTVEPPAKPVATTATNPNQVEPGSNKAPTDPNQTSLDFSGAAREPPAAVSATSTSPPDSAPAVAGSSAGTETKASPPAPTSPSAVASPSTEAAPATVVPSSAQTSSAELHPSTAVAPGAAPAAPVSAPPSTAVSVRNAYLGTLGHGAVGAIPGVEQVKKIGEINKSWFGDERMRAPASRRDIDGNPVPYSEQELAAMRGNNADQKEGVGNKVREGVARRRVDFNFGYNKAANEPIVEHVSPSYPAPPGSLEEMNALQERLARILAARAQAEAVRATSAADASHHQANTAPLQKFDQGSQRTITASEAHAQATARRQTAQQQREQKEGDVSGGIADYNQRKTGLSAITVPLGLIHDWAPLANSLPDGISAYPTALVGPKKKIAQLDKDATDFLKALNGVDAKMTNEAATQPARTKEVADNKQKLQGVQTGAVSSKATLTQAKTDGAALADRNQKRIGDSQKLGGQASATGSQLDGEKAKTEADMTSLAGRWQSWAQSHAQARATAIAATRKAMEAQGYKVREVNQK